MKNAERPAHSALVLAGRRAGALDPLAQAAGVTHKCLVPIAGRAMLSYPVTALANANGVGQIIVCMDDVAGLSDRSKLQTAQANERMKFVSACANLVDSVLASAREATFPLLITTADNVLLTPDIVDDFCLAAEASGAAAAVGFAPREAVLAAHADGQRKFYRFSCGEYSNCNLYWVRDRAALSAAEVFRSGGQFAKHPLRIAGALGLVNLIRFRLGVGTLDGAFARFSRRLRCEVRSVMIGDGAVAIDVDNARTKMVVEEILARRTGTASEATKGLATRISAIPQPQLAPMNTAPQ